MFSPLQGEGLSLTGPSCEPMRAFRDRKSQRVNIVVAIENSCCKCSYLMKSHKIAYGKAFIACCENISLILTQMQSTLHSPLKPCGLGKLTNQQAFHHHIVQVHTYANSKKISKIIQLKTNYLVKKLSTYLHFSAHSANSA